MKSIRRIFNFIAFNESSKNIKEEDINNILIDLIDYGLRIDFIEDSSEFIEFDIVSDDKFKLSEIEESIMVLEKYTKLRFEYIFDDYECENSYEYNSLEEMLESYNGYLSQITVVIYKD